MIIFKGKKKGIIHTRNITLDDIRVIFFPKTFQEKYQYLGCVPWNDESDILKAMEPLVIFMDNKAKPWWCPRWFLRFLHVFGSDSSIIRVRNFKLHNLLQKITKGLLITDYKTKWYWYDLRIHIRGTEQMNWLSDAIEGKFYRDGKKEDLINTLNKISPRPGYKFWSLRVLEEELEKYNEEE